MEYSIEFVEAFELKADEIITEKEQSDYYQQVMKIRERLELFPYCYPIYVSWKKAKFRKIIFKWYIIFYGIDEENKKIYIYNIFYQSEDWQSKISS